MKYYVSKGPHPNLGHTWDLSYYKMSSDRESEVIRIHLNGSITCDRLLFLNPLYVARYCKEITKEEYESILEL